LKSPDAQLVPSTIWSRFIESFFTLPPFLASNNKSENRDKKGIRRSVSAFFAGPEPVTAKLITGCL